MTTAIKTRRAAILWQARDLRFTAPAVLVAAVMLGRMAARLPVLPVPTGDSAAYLMQEAYRPPLYGWLLEVWQAETGGLAHLPLAQLLLLGCGVLVVAVELGRLLGQPLLGVATVPLLLLHPAVHDSPRWLLTECPFLACVLLGLGLLLRHARRPDPAALLVAMGCFGLATLLRSTGAAFLPLPLLVAACDPRLRPFAGLRQAALAALLGAAVLGTGMAWTATRNGHFELGSWAGISLLGKALVLVREEDRAGLPAPVAAMAPDAANARRLIASQPELAARLRAQVQASGDVRFPIFWTYAPTTWPEWAAADGREKGQLARGVAGQLIAAHPGEYLVMVGRDWLSLVLHPAYWPAHFTTVAANQTEFPFCGELGVCWGLERYDLPWHGLPLLLGVSLGGAALGGWLLLRLAWPVLRRRAPADAVLAFGIAAVLHGSLLATAAVEAGHVRYTVAIHALGVILLLRLAAQLLAWRLGR
jgi:hypothetical protein